MRVKLEVDQSSSNDNLANNKSLSNSIKLNTFVHPYMEIQTIQKCEILLDFIHEISLQPNFRPSNCKIRKNSAFYSPKILQRDTISKVLKILLQKFNLSHSILDVSFIYFDRVLTNNVFNKSKINLNLLFLVSIFLAAKYLQDLKIFNEDLAFISNLSLDTLNVLELEIIFLIRFSLYVPESDFQRTNSSIQTLCNNLLN